MLLEEQAASKNRYQVYLIGLFNLAVEFEHLKKDQESLATYIKLKKIIEGSDEDVHHFLLESVNKAILSLQASVRRRGSKMKSQSIDPFHRAPKLSIPTFTRRKSSLSVSSKLNATETKPLGSTELCKLPLLTQSHNNARTAENTHKSTR